MSLAWLKANVLVGSVSKLVAASLFIATFGITGCGDDPVKAGVAKGCTLNSDCKGGLVCSFGLCHQECQESDDCPSGQRCLKTGETNVCQLDEEAKCHFRSDCEDPLVCAIDLQCRNQCKADKDCLAGQKCADNTCAEPKEVNDEGGLINAVGFGGEGGGGSDGPSTGGKGGTGGTAGTSSDMGGEGGTPPVECVPDVDCIPDGKPCVVGTVSCAGGVATCEIVSDADDGTECGTDEVCSAGECVACKAGESCDVDGNDGCLNGELSCATGPSCEVAGNVKNGTSCGTDKVCGGGSCVACVAGEACDPPGQLCKNGVVACSAGPVCTPTTNKAAGYACDTDKVCDSAAKCVACVDGAACEPSDECHKGQQECTNGPNCVDQQTAVDDGISCTSGAGTYNFCTGGVCLACQQGGACIPPADVCHKGTLNCGTNPPTCNATVNNATDGTSCGDNKSCIGGTCLTNNRTLSITSGAVADVPIDGPFAAVKILLVDDTSAPVPATAITVTASAGAYAQAANTDLNGKSSILGRVGRAIGKHKFTVSAPGATSVEFEVNAVAPADDNIFTLVNVNHLSGVPTTPVAGTLSKLYAQARAVTAAKDGTLYIADYGAVFKLTPQGVLTRVVGDPNGSTGDTGDNGPGVSAKLGNVGALALDEVNHYLYIADYSYARVRLYDLPTAKIYGFAGGSGNSNVSPWGDGFQADGAYLSPTGLGVAPNGDVYISDYNSGRIRKVDTSGQISTFIDTATSCPSANQPLTFLRCDYYPDGCSFAWSSAGKLFISARFCGDGSTSGFRGIARVNDDMSLTRIAGTVGAASLSEGGAATSVGFSHTPSIAFDKAGNLFVATSGDNQDSTTGENLIRRIDALTYQITTVAGNGSKAYAGEYVIGTSAGINTANTLAFDDANNLYFADFTNYAIRGLWNVGDSAAATGKLATTSGNNQTVKRDATFASLVVKVTDSANNNVAGVPVRWSRKETGSGLTSGLPSVTTTTSQQGTVSMGGRVGLASGAYHFEASFTDIHGSHVTGSPQTFTITAEDPAAATIFTAVNAGHTSNSVFQAGPATFANLYSTVNGVVAASDGTIYVSDYATVYKVTARGEISLFAGTTASPGFAGDSGPAAGAKLSQPKGMALDEANGILYIADSGNQRIRAVSLGTTPPKISTFAGGVADNNTDHGDGGPATNANLGSVVSVTVGPDGKVYIPDPGHYSIRVVDAAGTISPWFTESYQHGNCVAGVPSFYYADTHTVVRFASNGDAYVGGYICQGTNTGSTLGILLRAAGGTFTRIAGLNTGAGTEGALGTATLLPDLGDFVFDSNGDIIVALLSDHRVRKIDKTTNAVTTIAGDGTFGYLGDYVAATGSKLYNPTKLAVWPGNHLMVADQNNQAIRMIW